MLIENIKPKTFAGPFLGVISRLSYAETLLQNMLIRYKIDSNKV